MRDPRDPGMDWPPLLRVLWEFRPQGRGAVVTTRRAGDRAWAETAWEGAGIRNSR